MLSVLPNAGQNPPELLEPEDEVETLFKSGPAPCAPPMTPPPLWVLMSPRLSVLGRDEDGAAGSVEDPSKENFLVSWERKVGRAA